MKKQLSPEEVTSDQSILIQSFQVIEDPRKERKKLHPLINILVMALVAVAAGANSWYQIEDYCEYNEEWFGKYLDLKNGLPSHDTFRRVFGILLPEVVQNVLQEWLKIKAIEGKPGRQISFDGKALRGSKWGEEGKPVHILNAFDVEEQITLGQVAVEEKANEIVAMPDLIDHLELRGAVCSGDAMLTQKKIVDKIIKKGGHYCLALKKNHLKLFNKIEKHLSNKFPSTLNCEEIEKNKGWIEKRTVWASGIERIPQAIEWKGLKSIVKIQTEKTKQSAHTIETRYYLSSLEANPKKHLGIIRKHWGIENGLHRTLDVIFREDECQVRDRNGAANLSILRKLAGSVLRQIPGRSLKQRMMGMQMSDKFRDLFIKCDF